MPKPKLTPEQSAAYINAMVANMNLQAEGMRCKNIERLLAGAPLAYEERDWAAFVTDWEPVLGDRAMMALFSPDLIVLKGGRT